MEDRETRMRAAATEGLLGKAALDHLLEWRSALGLPDWAGAALDELIEENFWDELNDRFFRDLEFGTAGMRGRTVGGRVATAEGKGKEFIHGAVGAACMNDFNVIRAAVALHRHCVNWLRERGAGEDPTLAIAYDVRFFSRHFADITARVWEFLGGRARPFAEPRSTPQLSFAVRHLGTAAGVVITASHNPYHDNGFKAYFSDGAQVIGPHASGIMDHFSKISIGETCALLKEIDCHRRRPRSLGPALDRAYVRRLLEVPIDRRNLDHCRGPIIYTPLHGTAITVTERLAERLKLPLEVVPEQRNFDPFFSTVPSPNPADGGSLAAAMGMADGHGAELVLAADPDGDRLAVAHRDRDGLLRTLSGNGTALLIAGCRLRALAEAGWLNAETAPHMALIRSFVTTPLLDLLAAEYGVKVVETPIGFKWIGAKLEDYERKAVEGWRRRGGRAIDYRQLSEKDRRDLLLTHSTYCVLGAEESGGYMALDITRDKDSHAALLMVCEAYGALCREGRSVRDFFDSLYATHGYHGDRLHTVHFPGADGAEKIATFLRSLATKPHMSFAGQAIVGRKNFERDRVVDGDGKILPAQCFHILDLEGGQRVAIRGSGTEPKIKFYLFASEKDRDLESAKKRVESGFDRMETFIGDDVARRIGER